MTFDEEVLLLKSVGFRESAFSDSTEYRMHHPESLRVGSTATPMLVMHDRVPGTKWRTISRDGFYGIRVSQQGEVVPDLLALAARVKLTGVHDGH